MKKQEKLKELLQLQLRREEQLKIYVSAMQQANDELYISRFGRWFGSGYLITKRIITTILTLAILFFSAYLIIAPENVFSDKQIVEMVKESKREHSKLLGKTIGETILGLMEKGTLSVDVVNQEFSKALEYSLKEELYKGIQFIGFLLLPLVFFLFYVSRLTKKMWQRNDKISEAQKFCQDLISHHIQNLESLRKDIKQLKNILHDEENQNHSSSNMKN